MGNNPYVLDSFCSLHLDFFYIQLHLDFSYIYKLENLDPFYSLDMVLDRDKVDRSLLEMVDIQVNLDNLYSLE